LRWIRFVERGGDDFRPRRRVIARRRRYDVAFYTPAMGPLLARDVQVAGGGAETQVYLVARALARRGLRVVVIAFEVAGLDLPKSVDGIDVVVRPAYRRGRGVVSRVREAVALNKAISVIDADVFVARSAGPAAGIVAARARTSRRRFVYASSSDADFGRLETRAANRALVRLALRLADRVLVQNEYQREICRGFTGRPVTVVGSIAEAAVQRSNRPSAFLWVGRPISYKRPLAYVELARAVPEAQFVMVAPTLSARPDLDLSAEVASAARDLPNLTILPAQGRKDLLELVEKAVAVVNTSEFEGMPNTFLEGWARGVPALAFSHDPDGVIGRHSLGTFAHGAWDEFVTGARALWSGRFDQHDVAARCRRYVADAHAEDTVSGQWVTALGVRPAGGSRSALAGVA
jgi:glycosyltransferase involved in cell wall biosynthesis